MVARSRLIRSGLFWAIPAGAGRVGDYFVYPEAAGPRRICPRCWPRAPGARPAAPATTSPGCAPTRRANRCGMSTGRPMRADGRLMVKQFSGGEGRELWLEAPACCRGWGWRTACRSSTLGWAIEAEEGDVPYGLSIGDVHYHARAGHRAPEAACSRRWPRAAASRQTSSSRR